MSQRVRRWDVLKKVFEENLQRKKLTIAEVGTWKGDFAVRILKGIKRISKFFCIDPYRDFSKGVYKCRRSSGWNQKRWDAAYNVVQKRLAPYGDRVVMIRNTSRKGAAQVLLLLDAVFIDGNHAYEFVLQDIEIWEAKVRSGGIVSGHDYGSKFHWGVQKAVDEYAKEHGRQLQVTGQDGVWWWIKP